MNFLENLCNYLVKDFCSTNYPKLLSDENESAYNLKNDANSRYNFSEASFSLSISIIKFLFNEFTDSTSYLNTYNDLFKYIDDDRDYFVNDFKFNSSIRILLDMINIESDIVDDDFLDGIMFTTEIIGGSTLNFLDFKRNIEWNLLQLMVSLLKDYCRTNL